MSKKPDTYTSYGYVTALADSVPEIKALLDKAKKAKWDVQRFTDALQTTHWWKKYSDSAKQMVALRASDPAEYKQRMAQAEAHVKQMSAQMGVSLTGKQIKAQATADLFQALDDTTLAMNIGSLYTTMPQSGGGTAVQYEQQLKQMAASYGLPVTQQWLDSHIKQSLMTGTGLEGAQTDLVNQAKSAYPTLAKLIDSGQTVQQIAQPYVAQMAQTLELDPSTINLSDPKIQQALTGQVQAPNISGLPHGVEAFRAQNPTGPKGAAGSTDPQPMTLYDFQKQLKNDPRWGRTDNAKQTAYGLVHAIGQMWGFAS